METVRKRSSGISSNGLRTWGMFFLLAGMLGKSILQNGLLNLGAVSFGQLLEQMQTSRAAMLYATLALLLQVLLLLGLAGADAPLFTAAAAQHALLPVHASRNGPVCGHLASGSVFAAVNAVRMRG